MPRFKCTAAGRLSWRPGRGGHQGPTRSPFRRQRAVSQVGRGRPGACGLCLSHGTPVRVQASHSGSRLSGSTGLCGARFAWNLCHAEAPDETPWPWVSVSRAVRDATGRTPLPSSPSPTPRPLGTASSGDRAPRGQGTKGLSAPAYACRLP
uniref:Uncharacterized protein n=1 Tax=Rousettus aegyptiacus TaxID=9407 RepID=A0A7J8JFI6_ROUAE|nr:hypothetical protein HJG63_010062 [Rousettus aegyptiacus]